MKNPDFAFRRDGIFVHILPEDGNKKAINVWNIIASDPTTQGGAIPANYWADVRKDIERAGFTVAQAKAKPDIDTDALAAELAEFNR